MPPFRAAAAIGNRRQRFGSHRKTVALTPSAWSTPTSAFDDWQRSDRSPQPGLKGYVPLESSLAGIQHRIA
jgi:hypothetical protein